MSQQDRRLCVVTGATGALGSAITRALWNDGASLLLVGRSASKLQETRYALEPHAGQEVYATVCDLESETAPARILEEAERRLGGVTVLVNNAGIQGPIGSVWENDWNEWARTWRVNLLAAVDLSRRVVSLMAANGRGKIISISGGGATAARPRFSAYATSKAALVRFSETLAREVESLNIDVNCIAPGAVNSAMTEAVVAAGEQAAGSREYADALKTRRAGDDGRRAAALCAFLASPRSDGITGRLLSAVWDPWESLPAHLDDLSRSDIYTIRRIVPADRGLTWDQS